jgi:hypothetical protein
LCNQPLDVLRIVGAVGVVSDSAASVGADLILVDYPFERGTIAQAIFKDFGRNATQSQKVVVDERVFVFGSTSSVQRG